MNKAHNKHSKERMIHIRLDENTHTKLKMHAAASQTTIQQLVEGMIRDKYATIQFKDVKQ
jgi:predicted HicB family RNase H-like nuclease